MILRRKDCEASASRALNLRSGSTELIAGDIQHLISLQVQVAVQGLDEQIARSHESTERSLFESDAGEEFEVHNRTGRSMGYEASERAGRKLTDRQIAILWMAALGVWDSVRALALSLDHGPSVSCIYAALQMSSRL
jgi:hypothetical protein